jgi:hypothetical protein
MRPSRSKSVASALVISALCLASVTTAAAQDARACSAELRTLEEAKVALAKDAFFGAMESAGKRIGERGVDRIAEGLETGNAARTRAGVKVAQTGNALANTASFVSNFDSLILEPIGAYLDDPTEEALNKAFSKFLENVSKMAFEKALERSAFGTVGLVIQGGELVIGTSRWAVNEMIDQGHRQQMEAAIFGGGIDVALGTINNIYSQAPFFTSGPVTNRGWTAQNIGRMVTSEDELADIWKIKYRDFLKGGGLRSAQQQADTEAMLADGWPLLKRYWSFKRAEAFLEAGKYEFTRGMTRVQDKVARGELTTCADATPAATPPPAKPVKGAFGPPVKSFGHLAPPFENHEQKIFGAMTPTGYRFTLERKPASEGAITITHTFNGTVPDILKPGDILELSCDSQAAVSGKYPPNIGGGCHWYVEGSVTIDPVSTKGSFVGVASNGQVYATGSSKTRFKVGTGGKVLIRAAQGGYYWGSSDNWNPAEYVYTFVP